jgi:molecular chaperone HtpG
VADEAGMSMQFEKMMAAMGQAVPKQKRILEINPDHAVIAGLRELAAKDSGDERLGDFAEMLLDQALLAEGGVLKNPAKFAQRVANVMAVAVR